MSTRSGAEASTRSGAEASTRSGADAATEADAQLDELGFPVHPATDTLVVGCGNVLRGDDGVGPVLVRELWDEWFAHAAVTPSGVELVDGGTAGMDVAFKMRGVRRVVLVDAAATGSEPGTVFEVPGDELEHLPPLEGLHTHLFRWDHALAFARWLLDDDYPQDVTVLLVEVASVELGAPLSPAARRGLDVVKDRLVRELFADRASTPLRRPESTLPRRPESTLPRRPESTLPRRPAQT